MSKTMFNRYPSVCDRLLSELNISRPSYAGLIKDTTGHDKIYRLLNNCLRREIGDTLYNTIDRSKMSITPTDIETVKELL